MYLDIQKRIITSIISAPNTYMYNTVCPFPTYYGMFTGNHCYAIVPRCFLSLSILSRGTNLGIARAAPVVGQMIGDVRLPGHREGHQKEPLGSVFSYKLRYIAGFGLVEISTNPKPTIYRTLYENTESPNCESSAQQSANIRRGTPRFKMWQTHN